MKYTVTMRRTKIVLEEITVGIEAETAEDAIQEALGSSYQEEAWEEISNEQVLINLGNDESLKYGNYIKETAKAVIEGVL
ncbi:hypothetical protein F7R25_03790 [Burkholderia stagnalis]|uniref:Uncharacterized protein n=1 Tax=Burkholderia stagnalis TaxID=1503054 RepID=A0A6L3N2W5_9BURK|nr:hypothetical protein [Burkholderia stagnalis]KAB0640626.1 hypothetical protein F7R25_03790 [Burkholderia stagnalis]VWB05682.1 hypothetical protein BST28156_00077 [Burkholderia stagnalis]